MRRIRFFNMVSKYRLAISVAFLGILAFLLSRLDLGQVYDQILRANKLFLIAGISMFVFALVIKIAKFMLISRYYDCPLTFKQATLVELVGISLATLTPGRVGEGSKVILMKKQLGMPVSGSFGIVVLERLFDIIILSAGAFILSFYMVKNITILTGLLFLFFVVFLLVFLKSPDLFHDRVPQKYRKYLAVGIKNDKAKLLVIFVSTAVVWAFDAAFQWFLLRSFNTQLSFYVIYGIVCISTIAVFLSVMPAGIGTVDLSYLLLYTMVGVPMEIAASVLLIYRFFSILLLFLFTGLILNYYRMSFGDIKREVEE